MADWFFGRKYLLNELEGILDSKTYFGKVGRNLSSAWDGIPTTYCLLVSDRYAPHREVYGGTTLPYYERRGIISLLPR